MRIETPRDRNATFEPQLVRKDQRRSQGLDEKILALNLRGLSMRDIEAHLAELYGVNVGRDLISRVTDTVVEDVREWQQRPLDDVHPVLFLDALMLKIREGGTVQRKACSSPWASRSRASGTCSGSGSRTRRARSSGCRCSPSSSSAASATS